MATEPQDYFLFRILQYGCAIPAVATNYLDEAYSALMAEML